MDSRLSNAPGSMFNYIESNWEEYKLSNDLTEIVLTFPSITEQAWARARGRCMKIDHCVIEYRQQVPMNAAGTVIVEVHDTRLNADESLQATFTFPIRCNIDLHYFSSSFFSVKDPNPWGLYYRVEESNIINRTHFAKFKARLKMSTVKHSVDVVFKPQTVKIWSKEFTMEHVDFWHVGYAKVEWKLIRSTSALRLEQRPRLPELGPGETWAIRSTIGTAMDNESTVNDRNYPYSSLHRLQPSMLDPGESASVVGAERAQSNITISRNELQELVSNAVQSCINQNGATSTPKPL
ncbi:hypothetical protein V6N13_054450 [Hibiscus sabdariffa]|uniref:Movement protein BL1 n=1 Tax=Hibiscus sabdariffa TaxID=183260 RepID=A0ABR2DXR2_9ROSI